MKNIILLAPPAAGKGTLAQKLSINFGYVVISTGDMLREKAKTDETINEMMKSGKLISDDIVFKILEDKILKIDSPYILDGFPRTENQARLYDKLLNKLNKDIGVVMYIDAKEDELLRRIETRLICPKCKISYSTVVKELLPGPNKTCLKCNTELVSRDDDKEDIFRKRYTEYVSNTAPLIEYYEKAGIIRRITATDHDAVFEEAKGYLKE